MPASFLATECFMGALCFAVSELTVFLQCFKRTAYTYFVLLVTNILCMRCQSVNRVLLVVQLTMDMSFLYSYKPVLYPVAVSTFDQQCAEEQFENADNTVQSLVDLCCQKIVQVCR